MKVADICLEYGSALLPSTIGKPNVAAWMSQPKGLKELETENGRLKKMFADLSLVRDALKDVVGKKL